jgi:hypothetical protein
LESIKEVLGVDQKARATARERVGALGRRTPAALGVQQN